MTYRELLELYKTGKLEEEKRKEIEADIERQDAIGEYLFSEGDIPDLEEFVDGSSGTQGEENGEEQEMLKMIRQSIRRAFVKMGISVGAVVLAIVLFVLFLLPGIVDLFYYQPDKIVVKSTEYSSREVDRMSLDMAVYTELFIPQYVRNYVESSSRGYGDYDICIIQNSTYNERFTNVSGKIEKGKLTLYDTNALKTPAGNVFLCDDNSPSRYVYGENEEYAGAAGTKEQAYNRIDELNDNEMYVCYVTLDSILDYEDFKQFIYKNELDGFSVWCLPAIYGDAGLYTMDDVGFEISYSGSCVEWEREKYPNLLLWDTEIEDAYKNEEIIKQHFTSLLKYLKDQKKFRKMMEVQYEDEDFDNAVEAIEKNGIKIRGFSCIAFGKDDLLKLRDIDGVAYIYTEPLR